MAEGDVVTRVRRVNSNPLTCKSPRGRLPKARATLPPIILASFLAAACGPRARVPPLGEALRSVQVAPDSIQRMARSLAPTLYLHPDETFPLLRAVAVHHPTRPLIAYHLLWADDVHGAWIPFTNPTDQEIVWVEHDGHGQPVRLSTYWHGTTVTTDWKDKGHPAVDVQWGKHGLLPRATVFDDLPWSREPWLYYVFAWGLPDLWLGRLSRDGPLCFCGGYDRYLVFTERLELADRLDAIVVGDNPESVLAAIFGERYSRKRPWP
jgi:hypothetical protein